MKFTLEAPGAEGLRLISEIPDYPLCQIEGRNGIGKSLSARLLELASGGQPYAALPAAWLTLKQLGNTTIRIEGLPLQNGSPGVLEFRLDPNGWPAEPATGLGPELGSVYLDGQAIDWPTARALLRVVRIAGDESLVETLGRSLQEWSVQATSCLRQLRPAVVRWDHELSDIASLCEVTAEELLEQRAHAYATAQATATARQRLQSQLAEAERLSMVRANVDQARVRAELLPAASQRLANALQTQTEQLQRVRELERRSTAAVEARGRHREINDAVSGWESKLTLRARALNRALLAERQALSGLGLAERTEALEISEAVAVTRREITGLTARIAEVDSAGTIREFNQRLETQINSGPGPVHDAVVAIFEASSVTGDELSAGLRARREQLHGQPRAGELDQLEAERRTAKYRLELLDRLPSLIETSQRKERNVAEARDELAKLYSGSGSKPESSAELVRLQEEARSDLLSAGVELTQANADALAILGLGPSVPDADESDSDELDEDELDPDPTASARGSSELLSVVAIEAKWLELDTDAAVQLGQLDEPQTAMLVRTPVQNRPTEALVQAAAQFEAKELSARTLVGHEQRNLLHAEDISAQATQTLTAVRTKVRSAVRALARDDDWSQWRPGAERVFTSHDMPLDHAAAILAGEAEADGVDAELLCTRALSFLAGFSEQLGEAASQVRDGFAALAGYLSLRAQALAPRVATASEEAMRVDRRVGASLVPWLESRLSDALSAPELREELFEGAEEIRLDLDRMQIAWPGPDGRMRRRPLEAFSSGEQVFAYTRAKLGQLTDLRNRHRSVVVVLDEFGAFVARDRFGQLLSFVRHEALGPIADQVIVMLPLAVNYLADESAEAVAQSEDDEPGSVADRVRQLQQRGYFAISAGAGR